MGIHADLPPEFDPDHYRARYDDMQTRDDAEVAAHFAQYGRSEGREASAVVLREGFLSQVVKRVDGDILEIGPFCNPIVAGPNVAYLDIIDADELRALAPTFSLDPAKVPAKIDFVGDISTVDRKFAAVVGSHSIEHQPNLVHHLSTVAKILEDGGRYCLIVPDKRYCFDALKPETTIGDVLQAHHEGRTRHSLQSVVDHHALWTHNEPARHWVGDSGVVTQPELEERIRAGMTKFDEEAGAYIDSHAWYFTSESFRLITDILFNLGLSDLKPVRVYNTPRNQFEFCAVLEKVSR